MNNDQYSTEYAGARQTELIDRQEILDLIAPTLNSPDLWVFHITGRGGMGKTCLAREILRRCSPDGMWANVKLLAMQDVVDLYHTRNHVEDGFAQEVADALQAQFAKPVTPAGNKRAKKRTKKELAAFAAAWKDYHLALEAFSGSQPESAGVAVMDRSISAGVTQYFLTALQTLSESYHLVLAIDTAEKMLYESDAVQKQLNIDAEEISTLKWLLEKLLPTLRNTTLIITGRPEPEEVFERLQGRLANAMGDGGHFKAYSLDRFALPDALAYFEATALAAQTADDIDSASRIRSIPDETREVIWHYTDGRPILLALLIDYLISSKELLPQVKDTLAVAYLHQSVDLRHLREAIEEDLVRFWEESHRQTSVAVIALGWARKGMNAELLARVADFKSGATGEYDQVRAQNLLDALKNLSFVKIRPSDKRYFLHDEMYDLLERHVLKRALDPERERVYQAILEYYEMQVRNARLATAQAGQPRRSNVPAGEPATVGLPKPPDDLNVLAETTRRLYDLIAEEVHYRLRYHPLEGFHSYQAYAKEAFWNNDDIQDALLRSEILDFLKIHREEEQIDQLRRAEIEVGNGLRHIERLVKTGHYLGAIDLATRIELNCQQLIQQAGPLARLRLAVLHAEATIYLGDNVEPAGKALEAAIIELQALRNEPVYRWQQQTTLAEAHNTLGYYFRTLGFFKRAVTAYEESVALWRQLEDQEPESSRKQAMRAQHANSLNNLAWACAEYGLFGRATRYAKDALEMRKELGPLLPVAFSENTLGLILTRYGRPLEARVHCQRALETFTLYSNSRGQGLARTALSEALRRASDQEDLFAPEEKADLLREAHAQVAQAANIFTHIIPERGRRVEAYLELGCVYRQWAWLRPKYESAEDPSPDALAAESEQAFQQAITEAGEEHLFFKALDARVNLAWLHYYTRKNNQAEQATMSAIATVPIEYLITQERGLPDQELPHAFYWVQLGKAYSLFGQVDMRRFQDGILEALMQAGLHFTLSLAYDQLFATDFRDMRREMDRLYERLVKLNKEEFKVFHAGIVQAVRDYHLPPPLRINQFLNDYSLPSLIEPVQ